MHVYNKDSPLVGHKWYTLFQDHNEDVGTTVGVNLEQNRNDHMTHATFTMMFDQIEKSVCLSGYAQRLDNPAHMDAACNPVKNKSLAVGYPVTIETIRCDNIFFMDKTGDNTHGKKDGRRGGEKFFHNI